MSVKKQLQHSIWVILKHNKDGSFATQANRKKIGYQIAASLLEAGYKLRHMRGLKPKHIRCLVTKWQQSGLAVGTIKNRLACVNWFCEKIDKPGIVLSSAELGIGKRVYVSNENKAIQLDETLLAKISDKNIQLSLRLQQQFGLRREEALKLKPFIADKETELELQGSWCKNGRPRTVPIRTTEQRKILEQCKQHLQSQQLSMIPKEKSYIQHLKVYEQQLRRAGIYHAHGLRHAYAQQRYKELTSWDCPACGGRSSKDYRGNDKAIDKRAREIISEELGHTRIAGIVAQYVGR
ncbi:MAG: integrase domain-containing protein [Gammaproteobacteria bacterium]|nr:integrase domain-containing protein [Gammaproteobacteria bacterium]